jgi:replicative DNA helicase
LDRNWEAPADTDTFGHRQPAAPDAERALLGAALINPNVINEVGAKLEPDDFYITKHGDIFVAMQELMRKREPVDIVTVRSQLGEHPSVDGSFLADLMNAVPGVPHVESYVNRIKNAARKRSIIQAAGEISSIGYDEPDSVTAEENAKQTLLRALDQDRSSQRILSPKDQSDLLVAMFEERARGEEPALPTGYPALDGATNGGFRGGELIVIGATTSVGKSSYAENIAENIARRDYQVLYFNLEMSDRRMMERAAKRTHKMSTSAFLAGPTHAKDVAALTEIAEERSQMPLTLISNGMASTAFIWAVTAQHVMRYGSIDMIVVDYLQLLKDKQTKSGSEVLRIAQMTASLKALAMEHEVPVMLVSQLNRDAARRSGEPELHDLRESGAIEQDADIVILLWKDDGDEVHAKIAKQRDGPILELPIHFQGEFFTFTEPHSHG